MSDISSAPKCAIHDVEMMYQQLPGGGWTYACGACGAVPSLRVQMGVVDAVDVESRRTLVDSSWQDRAERAEARLERAEELLRALLDAIHRPPYATYTEEGEHVTALEAAERAARAFLDPAPKEGTP